MDQQETGKRYRHSEAASKTRSARAETLQRVHQLERPPGKRNPQAPCAIAWIYLLISLLFSTPPVLSPALNQNIAQVLRVVILHDTTSVSEGKDGYETE